MRDFLNQKVIVRGNRSGVFYGTLAEIIGAFEEHGTTIEINDGKIIKIIAAQE